MGIEVLVSFLVWCLILGIAVYAVYVIVGMLHLPPPLLNLVYLIMAVIVLVALLDRTGR